MASETGHNRNIKMHAVFYLDDNSKFQKIILLIAIFEKVDIQKKEYVAINFNTMNKAILKH